MKTHIPYVYRLTDKLTGKRYIGARYAKVCEPSDLGVEYFTSSKVVRPLFMVDPDRFEKQIIVTGNKDYVIKVEFDLIELYDAVLSLEFYNRTNAKGVHPEDVARGNQILHSIKNKDGKSVVGVNAAAKSHAAKDESGKSKVAVKNMTALHERNKDELGRSRIALNALSHVDRSLDERGKMKVTVNAALKLHSVKDANGKSVAALKLHADKDERGKSLVSVKAAKVIHSVKDDKGRSVVAMKGHAEKDQSGKSLLAARTIGVARTVVWRCLECGKEALSGPLGMHQKHSGHEGKERAV